MTDYYDVAYLNPVSAGQTTMWNCTVLLNDHEVPFKVDTGAEVTVISEDQWKSLGMSEVKPPSKKLHGPDNKPLNVRRNQSHLSPRPGEGPSATAPTEPQQRTIATWSQTGTYVGPPSRLTYWKRGDVAYL